MTANSGGRRFGNEPGHQLRNRDDHVRRKSDENGSCAIAPLVRLKRCTRPPIWAEACVHILLNAGRCDKPRSLGNARASALMPEDAR